MGFCSDTKGTHGIKKEMGDGACLVLSFLVLATNPLPSQTRSFHSLVTNTWQERNILDTPGYRGGSMGRRILCLIPSRTVPQGLCLCLVGFAPPC